jgi:hypothetical protein
MPLPWIAPPDVPNLDGRVFYNRINTLNRWLEYGQQMRDNPAFRYSVCYGEVDTSFLRELSRPLMLHRGLSHG